MTAWLQLDPALALALNLAVFVGDSERLELRVVSYAPFVPT